MYFEMTLKGKLNYSVFFFVFFFIWPFNPVYNKLNFVYRKQIYKDDEVSYGKKIH